MDQNGQEQAQAAPDAATSAAPEAGATAGPDAGATAGPRVAGRAGASALHAKLAVGAAVRQSRVMTLAKALRLTTAKVADTDLSLAMAAIGLRVEDRDGDALAPLFDAPGLMLLLDGPGGQRGAAMLDDALVGALIQQQTMGQVRPVTDGTARTMTATDAAMAAPFVEALLAQTADLSEAAEDRLLLTGYRFGVRVEESRLLLLALQAPRYRLATLTLDIAGGVRQGQLLLCLPERSGDSAAMPPPEVELAPASPPPGADRLCDNVLGATLALQVALQRLPLSVGVLGGLKIGDVLPLGAARFDRVHLMAPGGRVLSTGTLGQQDGQRALRLTAPAAQGAPWDDAAGFAAQGEAAGALPEAGAPQAAAPPPSIFDLDGVEGLADLPELPELGAAPMAADGPGAMAGPDLPKPPAMSDLPDLPDLPEMPALSDLPQSDVA